MMREAGSFRALVNGPKGRPATHPHDQCNCDAGLACRATDRPSGRPLADVRWAATAYCAEPPKDEVQTANALVHYPGTGSKLGHSRLQNQEARSCAQTLGLRAGREPFGPQSPTSRNWFTVPSLASKPL
jgi:hypothetical protein